MADLAPSDQGRIFISYRREETAYAAGWLYDRLRDHYGGGQVFKDVDSIELGDDFVEVISRAVGFCDVLLALIGDDWLTITDELGHRRLDDPDDFVRLEIEAALTRNVRVIPILVDGARMPGAKELPESLARLSRRQALELNPARFDFDTGRLLRVLDNVLADVRAVEAVPDATAEDRPPAAATTPRVTAEPEATVEDRSGPAATAGRVGAVPDATAEDRPVTTLPSPPQRQRNANRTWLLAGTGIAVVLIVLIAALPNLRSRSGPLSSSAASPSPAAKETVVFRDSFSKQAAGWEADGAVAEETGYTGGAYRISSQQVDYGATSAPLKASRVWPSAPPRTRIAVEGRRLQESDQEMTYGILCRFDRHAGYLLTIGNDFAKIEKWGEEEYVRLTDAELEVDAYSTNKLQAVCTGGQGQEAVHLELWVNGDKAVEFTDTEAPLPAAGVGLAVATGKTKRASVAEFDNFVVSQLA